MAGVATSIHFDGEPAPLAIFLRVDDQSIDLSFMIGNMTILSEPAL